MTTEDTIEITLKAFELAVDQGQFTSAELASQVDSPVSKETIESNLLYLQETGWLERPDNKLPMWIIGPTGEMYLSASEVESPVFRVLPSEVPHDESVR